MNMNGAPSAWGGVKCGSGPHVIEVEQCLDLTQGWVSSSEAGDWMGRVVMKKSGLFGNDRAWSR